MKNLKALLFSIIATVAVPFAVKGQAPTIDGSEYTYLYKLEKEQVRWMLDSAWLSDKSPILTAPVDSSLRIYNGNPFSPQKLARGYYLSAYAADLTINTQLHIHQPFFPTIQETNGVWWFVFKDTLQSIVKGGTLTMIGTKEKDSVIGYDSSCMCYPVPLQKQDRWFLFEKGTEFYYLKVYSPYKKVKRECTRPWWKFWKKCRPAYTDYNNYNYRYYRPRGWRRLWNWAPTAFSRPATPMQLNPGYMVINQPEYKHFDSLKMKAFIVNRKGKPLKKDLYVKITMPSNSYQTLLFKKITPVTRGAYTFDMAIPDTFLLDQPYTISITDKQGRSYKSQQFKVADYELKKVSYSWENGSQEYYRGNDIVFYAKSVDANNLPLPDATVRLKLRIDQVLNTYDTLITLPDSVFATWYDTLLACSPDGLTPIHLPQRLLPNADLRVFGTMNFTNADNQPGFAQWQFNILADSKRFFVKEDSNGLRAGYVVQGRIQKGIPARWMVEYTTGVRRVKEITLPYYQDWEPGATAYRLLDTSSRELAMFAMPRQIPKPPAFIVTKTYDSLHIDLQNPLGIEVGWRILSGKKLIEKGAGNRLSYHKKLKGTKPVFVVYTYTWGGNLFTYETIAWVKEKQLTVKIEQPETVYPGQEIAVDITVTDYKNHGASGVNLTAYSVNMEFENISYPQLPYYGKSYGGQLVKKPINNMSLWEKNYQNMQPCNAYLYKWMGLARHPYYRLMYSHTALGVLKDSLSDGKTQLSLFAKNPQTNYKNYYAAWIDDSLVYLNLSGQVPNAYRVKPGKHKITLRTYEGLYETDSIECVAGMRTLVGLNVDSVYNNRTIKRTEMLKEVKKEEYGLYQPHVLYITGDKNSMYGDNLSRGYLRQGAKIYNIGRLQKSYTYGNNDNLKNNPYYFYKVGPFEKGWIDLIIDQRVITFFFNPEYVYTYSTIAVMSSDVNYDDFKPQPLPTFYSFADTATELPPPPPEEPKVNIIPNYASSNPLQHPGMRTYYHPYWVGKGCFYRVANSKANRITNWWFINNDSLEMSTVIAWQTGMINPHLVPGNYDIVMLTDTNSFKLLRNVQVRDSFIVFYNPTDEGFMKYDTLLMWSYLTKIKLINRGSVPEYYKTPVRLKVTTDNEPAKGTEKVVGELSINSRYISNALVVIEDGKGGFINGGLTNQYGFYQIPLKPGTYFMKIFTPQWDMFHVEKITVTAKKNTIANLHIGNYSPEVLAKSFSNLPRSQTSEKLTNNGTQPKYENTVSGNCTGNACGEIRGIITDAASGEPLISAVVTLDGYNIGTATDFDGAYRIKGLSAGTYTLVVKYIGYQTQKVVNVNVGAEKITYLNVELRENVSEVGEVIVTEKARMPVVKGDEMGYDSETYYLAAPPMMNESITMMDVAAVSSKSKGRRKLLNSPDFEEDEEQGYEDDYNPFRGNALADSIDVNWVDRKKEAQRLQGMLGDSNALQVRKTFRDYGYWIPNLVTNRRGKAGFTVKLPDNQTQWLSFVPAMDGKRRTGLGTATIKAYKSLTANLSVPRVMVAGDRLEITGKTVNYTSDSVVVNALLRVNDKDLYNNPMGLRYYQLVQQFLEPEKAGETVVQYSIKMDNGYLDGEIRNVPVLDNGLLVNNGESQTLDGNLERTLYPEEGFINRELMISNRKVVLLEAELNKLRNYQYGCVEQTASKLKALLLEKQFAKALNKPFTDEKEISQCIKRLEKYQNPDGTWGWWNRTATDYWMTIYATDALQRAIKAGYKTKSALTGGQHLWSMYQLLPIPHKINSLELFINGGFGSVADKIARLDTLNLNLQERYTLMKAKQASGIKINTQPLLEAVRQPNEKQAVWGEKVFNISVNELQTSAVVYEILRKEGGHDELLKKVRNYFLSQPHTSRNTIESATVLQTFMQDIVTEDSKRQELTPDFSINGKATPLPLVMKIAPADTVKLAKKGSELFYVYAWQKFEANPDARKQIFDIRTMFEQNKRISDTLEAGKPVTMHISMTIDKEREYVMLEIPIPAGFSYQSKTPGYAYETHREHFDDKVAIFFSKLPRGLYSFKVELLPKFKGEVTLLPARAEEMYFPLHFGNNAKRRIVVR